MKRAMAIGSCSLAMLISTASSAADLKILTASAYKSVAVALAPGFEQRTGHKVVIDIRTAHYVARLR